MANALGRALDPSVAYRPWGRASAPFFAGFLLLSGCVEDLPLGAETGTEDSRLESGPGSDDGGASTGDPRDSQTPACSEYMACIREVDPSSVDLAGRTFGGEGSCWAESSSEATDCDRLCQAGLERLCPERSVDGDSDDGAPTSGEPGPPLCATQTLSTGDSWLVSGEASGEIPADVGDALERNCGCHFADLDTFEANTPLYYGSLRMSTWSDFQGSFRGRPVYAWARARAVPESSSAR